MAKKKKRITKQQEFEIMKLMLEKFLWLGFIIMGWGLAVILRDGVFVPGVWYIIAGSILLILFAIIIVKEYEVIP